MKRYIIGKGKTAGTISALYGLYGDLVLCYKGQEDNYPGCKKVCEVEILTEQSIIWGTDTEIKERFCDGVEELLFEKNLVYRDVKDDIYWMQEEKA